MKNRAITFTILFAFAVCLQVSAKKADPETAKLIAKTEKYLKLVQAQPDWLVSRLQMYWTTHATDVYINGEKFDHPGGQRSPEPTVKYTGTRGTESAYDRPKLEDVVPYDDDDQGDVTFISKSTGKMEKAHPSKTGRNISSLNRQIIGIARDAAKIYAATGDTAYGNMAARVFDVYMKGIYYRNVPIDLNHGHQQTLVGMTEFEVIHEDVLEELTQMYPLIKKVLGDKMLGDNGVSGKSLTPNNQHPTVIYDAAFKKWAENIIANGVPHNNWDLFQADFVMKIALVLDDDSQYPDRKGKQYYLDYICHKNSIRQWSMDKLIDFGFDKHSKIWYEAPGYSLGVLGTFADLANRLDRDGGVDLFSQHPILIDAVKTSPEYLFPNRMFAGFGDTHPNYMSTNGMDNIISYAARHKNKLLTNSINTLKTAVSPEAPVADVERYTSGMFYSPNVSWLAMRTGMDKNHDLMASLNGSLGNHQHANGISLELYGKGYVLGPDAGIGKYLYSGLDYSEYYSQMPAHNTVVVDGISSYPVMMSNHAFKLVKTYPEVSAEKPSSGKLLEKKDSVSYATVSFLEPETQADQQRTVVMIKTSDKGGYYIDVFRSRKQAGGDKTHDYFYHNLGQTMTLTDFDDKPLQLQPTDELAFAGGHLYAYSYIYNKESVDTKEGVKATFTVASLNNKEERINNKEADGNHKPQTIKMTMWMAPSENRTVFKALSPANLEYERMPNQPYDIKNQPVLTFVARQHGEAWTHPFVSVFEPSSDAEPGDIASVSFFAPEAKNAVGIKVKLKDGRTQTFVCKENGEVDFL